MGELFDSSLGTRLYWKGKETMSNIKACKAASTSHNKFGSDSKCSINNNVLHVIFLASKSIIAEIVSCLFLFARWHERSVHSNSSTIHVRELGWARRYKQPGSNMTISSMLHMRFLASNRDRLLVMLRRTAFRKLELLEFFLLVPNIWKTTKNMFKFV